MNYSPATISHENYQLAQSFISKFLPATGYFVMPILQPIKPNNYRKLLTLGKKNLKISCQRQHHINLDYHSLHLI